MKFKTTFVGEQTTSKYLRCDFAEWKMKFNSPRGSFNVVVVISMFFANYSHHHKFQRPSNYP